MGLPTTRRKRNRSGSSGQSQTANTLLEDNNVPFRVERDMPSASPTALTKAEPGSLHLFILSVRSAASLRVNRGDSYVVTAAVEAFSFKGWTEPAKASADGDSIEWLKPLSTRALWSPSQIKVPLLRCSLQRAGEDTASASAHVDLAPLCLRPMELLELHLPLTPIAEAAGASTNEEGSGAYLAVRVLYVPRSTPSERAQAYRDRLIVTPGDAMELEAAITGQEARPMKKGMRVPHNIRGKLEVQLLSVTKLRRACTGFMKPVVRLSMLTSPPAEGGKATETHTLTGSVSPFGEYSIYFDGAEAMLEVPSSSVAAPLLELSVMEDATNESVPLGTLQVPLFSALCKQGHVIDACYPLRAPGSCVKMADLRMSLHFIPDNLAFVERPLPTNADSEQPDTRTLYVRPKSMRTFYSADFPGQKDLYAEVSLVRSGGDGSGEECVVCSATSSVAGTGYDYMTWNDQLELAMPQHDDEDGSGQSYMVAITVRSAAVVVADGRHDVLGILRLQWPMDSTIAESNAAETESWYTLTHPTDPGLVVGELELSLSHRRVLDTGQARGASVGLEYSATVAPSVLMPSSASAGPPPSLDARARPRRCQDVDPCGPGYLSCRVGAVECATRQGQRLSVQPMCPTAMYIQVRGPKLASASRGDADAGGDDGSRDSDAGSAFTVSSAATDTFTQHLHEEELRSLQPTFGPQRRGDQGREEKPGVHVVVPLTHGPETHVQLVFGRGSVAEGRTWLRAVVDTAAVIRFPGREMQVWRMLFPVAHGQSDGSATQGPATGRVLLLMRYVPHTFGTLTARLGHASFTCGPEASLRDRQLSAPMHQLFVRMHVLPGGPWTPSSLREVMLPVDKGRACQSVSWDDEEVHLEIDTTMLPLLSACDICCGPSIELALFNNGPVMENCVGCAIVSLSDVLSLKAAAKGEINRGVALPLVYPLTRAQIGTMTVSFSYVHLYTPAVAMGGLGEQVDDASLSEGNGETVQPSQAGALRELKRLFYTLDRDGSGSVSQAELLQYFEKPVGGGQEDGQSLLQALLKGSDDSETGVNIMASTRALFRSMDADGDGQISWEEWVSFLEVARLSDDAPKAMANAGLIQQNAQAMQQQMDLPSKASVRKPAGPADNSKAEPSQPTTGPAKSPLKHTAHVRQQPAAGMAPDGSPTGAWGAQAQSTAATPARRSKMESLLVSQSPAPRTPAVRLSVEDLSALNVTLKKRVQELEEHNKALQVRLRREVQAERTKLRKDMAVLVEAAKDKIGTRMAASGVDGTVRLATTIVPEEPAEELLSLRVVNDELRKGTQTLQASLQRAKGEREEALAQVDVLRSQLNDVRLHANSSAIDANTDVRRLEAARREVEKVRVQEIRTLLADLHEARHEVKMVRKDVQAAHEAHERARAEVEAMRKLYDQETARCGRLESKVQKYQAMLSALETDKLRHMARVDMTQQSLEEAMRRRDEEVAEKEEQQRTEDVAARRIQSSFRGFEARKGVCREKAAVLSMQDAIRMSLAVRRLKRVMQRRRYAAITLQTVWRRYSSALRVKKMSKAVIKLQATMRGALDRKRHRLLPRAARAAPAAVVGAQAGDVMAAEVEAEVLRRNVVSPNILTTDYDAMSSRAVDGHEKPRSVLQLDGMDRTDHCVDEAVLSELLPTCGLHEEEVEDSTHTRTPSTAAGVEAPMEYQEEELDLVDHERDHFFHFPAQDDDATEGPAGTPSQASMESPGALESPVVKSPAVPIPESEESPRDANVLDRAAREAAVNSATAEYLIHDPLKDAEAASEAGLEVFDEPGVSSASTAEGPPASMPLEQADFVRSSPRLGSEHRTQEDGVMELGVASPAAGKEVADPEGVNRSLEQPPDPFVEGVEGADTHCTQGVGGERDGVRKEFRSDPTSMEGHAGAVLDSAANQDQRSDAAPSVMTVVTAIELEPSSAATRAVIDQLSTQFKGHQQLSVAAAELHVDALSSLHVTKTSVDVRDAATGSTSVTPRGGGVAAATSLAIDVSSHAQELQQSQHPSSQDASEQDSTADATAVPTAESVDLQSIPRLGLVPPLLAPGGDESLPGQPTSPAASPSRGKKVHFGEVIVSTASPLAQLDQGGHEEKQVKRQDSGKTKLDVTPEASLHRMRPEMQATTLAEAALLPATTTRDSERGRSKIGQRVSVRLALGEDVEMFTGRVVGQNALSGTVSVCFDEDEGLVEEYPVDSPDLQFLPQHTSHAADDSWRTSAEEGQAQTEAIDGTPVLEGWRTSGLEAEDSAVKIEQSVGGTGDAAATVVETVPPSLPGRPAGAECVGWELKMSLDVEGESDVFFGQVVRYNQESKTLSVLFDGEDEPADVDVDDQEIEFVRRL